MYTHIHICIHTCTYIHMIFFKIHMYITYIYMCLHNDIYIYIYTYSDICIYTDICIFVHTYLYIYICKYIDIFTLIRIYIDTRISTYIYLHMCIDVNEYICTLFSISWRRSCFIHRYSFVWLFGMSLLQNRRQRVRMSSTFAPSKRVLHICTNNAGLFSKRDVSLAKETTTSARVLLVCTNITSV